MNAVLLTAVLYCLSEKFISRFLIPLYLVSCVNAHGPFYGSCLNQWLWLLFLWYLHGLEGLHETLVCAIWALLSVAAWAPTHTSECSEAPWPLT